MARTSNITFAQVAQIADTMKAAGTRPTARAVRERIGSGSMGTIHKLLQQWAGKARTEDDETEAPELPSSIASTLMDFVATQVAEACEPLNDELNAARATADMLADDNERMHHAFAQQGEDLLKMLEGRASEKARADANQQDLADARAEIAQLRETVAELRRDLDRSQRQTEMFAGLQPDLAAARAALADCDSKRQEAEKAAAVLVAQIEAANNRNDELWARFAEQRSYTEKLEAEAKQANNHYQACAARLEAAAREITDLKEAAKKARAKPATTTVKPKAKPEAEK